MNKNKLFLILGVAAFFLTTCNNQGTTAHPPNILFFITDDESWLERSAYGWSDLPTPHFDRVAEEGVLFTNAFTSAPSCAPSRATVLTGRNFWELKQGAFIQSFIPVEFPVFTDLLSASGYHVGYTGKANGPNSYPKEGYGPVVIGRNYNLAKIDQPANEISSTDYAANFDLFLKDRKPGQPFFFWAGTIEPHDPFGENNHLLLEREFGITLDQVPLPPRLEDNTENRQQKGNQLYEICYADTHLGRMLTSLEVLGELDNTLVVVTSDNGTAMAVSNTHYGKASPYDYGVHEPLSIMWPNRISAGRTVTDFISFADFAPTFLEVAGIKSPFSMSGRSILPLLDSKKSGRIDPKRNFIVTGLEWHGESLSNEHAILPSKVEFYDLINDPWQLNDLADNPDYSDEMQKLARKLRQIGMQTRDPRVTGEMDIFLKTRQYVQKRKQIGYGETRELPFDGLHAK